MARWIQKEIQKQGLSTHMHKKKETNIYREAHRKREKHIQTHEMKMERTERIADISSHIEAKHS